LNPEICSKVAQEMEVSGRPSDTDDNRTTLIALYFRRIGTFERASSAFSIQRGYIELSITCSSCFDAGCGYSCASCVADDTHQSYGHSTRSSSPRVGNGHTGAGSHGYVPRGNTHNAGRRAGTLEFVSQAGGGGRAFSTVGEGG